MKVPFNGSVPLLFGYSARPRQASSPLQTAAESDCFNSIRFGADEKASPDKGDKEDKKANDEAVLREAAAILENVFGDGIDPFKEFESELSPKEIRDAVLDAMSDANPDRHADLLRAYEQVRAMLPPKTPQEEATSDLHGAIRWADLPDAAEALDRGADVNQGALHEAARQPLEFFQLLQQRPELDFSIPDKHTRFTAMQIAVHQRNWPVLTAMLRDARLDKSSPQFRQLLLKFPFGELDRQGHMPQPERDMLASLLAEPGIDVNAADSQNGWTALHYAAHTLNREAVELLLTQPGIRLDLKTTPQNKSGKTVQEALQKTIQTLSAQPLRKPTALQRLEAYQQMLRLIEDAM